VSLFEVEVAVGYAGLALDLDSDAFALAFVVGRDLMDLTVVVLWLKGLFCNSLDARRPANLQTALVAEGFIRP
jgi:hypothetical protein